ncbi:related to PLP1 - protein involved in actin and tubulin folding [Ustilago trichophora]|uniref:Related to PLP1 - protein involved in actin and tubulin folding n=1 Tax=Ustilago trichophora TaxID=86804 RepID=A0A5C3E8R7_9BASI|nr:related to PLP1 - protein involved in actin and tubulin folding [Ustilago trichophora]
MTDPSASTSTATAGSTSTEDQGSTFIETASAYHIGRNERDSDHGGGEDDEDDDEKVFAELDAELDMMEDEGNFGHDNGDTVAGFDMAEFRERRMEELRQEIAAHKATNDPLDLSSMQHTSTASMKGLLTEITNEKDLITFSSSERQVAIHFFHPKFSRCSLLDRHLTVLARLHPATLFLKANVLNCPFLTQKLKVSVLPCLITFKDGISKDKIVGFEELGNSDKFSTGALEWRLGQSGIVDPRENRKPIFGFGAGNDNGGGDSVGKGVVGARTREDDDDFWDDE